MNATTAAAAGSLSREEQAGAEINPRLVTLATLMDDRYRIPGTSYRVGLDGMIGLVPGVGDTVTSMISAYIVAECWRSGVSKRALAHMVSNVGVEFLIGLVPVFGDIFDIGFKANKRNLSIALKDLAKRQAGI